MALTGITVFLSAFLLFLVQPIIAKLILPRFGGSVAVWATCLVFFQAALLLGYAFAHLLVQRGHSRAFQFAHIVLLLGSLALLPIVPGPWRGRQALGPGAADPVLLVLTIGLPFTLLAMTSPLLQAWIAGAHRGGNPYRLFAVSNLASLAALLAYPWLIEPWLHTATQALAWSVAYAAYVLLLCAISLRRPRPAAAAAAVHGRSRRRRWPRTLTWFALAALGSYALVAMTNHLTQNIPSFPMMWVLPLVIYLLSFTLCFDADRWYPPRAYRAALLALLAHVRAAGAGAAGQEHRLAHRHLPARPVHRVHVLPRRAGAQPARGVAADAFLPGGVGGRRVRRRAGRAGRAGACCTATSRSRSA